MEKLYINLVKIILIVTAQHLAEAQFCDVTSWELVRCTKVNSLEELRNGLKNCSGKVEELQIQNSHLDYLTPEIFEGIEHIRMLRLFANNITQLPRKVFGKLTKLDVISANFNSIGNIDSEVFSGQTRLSKLYFTSNKMKYLPRTVFDDVRYIVALDLGESALKDVEFNAFHNFTQGSLADLTYLAFANNAITILLPNTFNVLNKLKDLRLDNNHISTVHLGAFSGLTFLVFLDLSSNRIERLPDGLFRDTPNLKYLYLYNNRLHSVKFRMFEGLNRLETLYLQNNNISIIHPHSFDAFQNHGCLKKLHIFNNDIENISGVLFQNLHLTELYLDEKNLNVFNEVLVNLSDINEVRSYNNKTKTLNNV